MESPRDGVYCQQGREIVKPRKAALLTNLCVSVIISLAAAGSMTARAAGPPKPTISEEASAALAHMGTTLQAKEFSFHARTIRVYADQNGELLHIAHAFKVVVRRPDRLLIEGTGDDGPRKLVYDGTTALLTLDDAKKYGSLPVPPTIQGMMHVVIGHFGVDFPLADFLTECSRQGVPDRCHRRPPGQPGNDRWRSMPPPGVFAAAGDRAGTLAREQ